MYKRLNFIILSGIFACAMPVSAQQFNDAASMPVGNFDFTPTLDVGLQYDDNILKDDENIIESWSRLIAPQFNFTTSTGVSDLVLAYRIANQTYFSSASDDYTDHFLSASADVELDARNRLFVNAKFVDGHDARGSNFTIGNGSSLTGVDTFKESQLDFTYSYGAFNADGRLEWDFLVVDKNYDINTDQYRARDRKFTKTGLKFLYRVGPLTDLAIDFERTYVDYKFAINSSNPLDSVQDSLLIGVEWEATAKTSGFAKIGYQQKDFDSALREDFQGVDWALGVVWEPEEYSSIELITRADTNETNGEGNFIRANVHSIKWNHDWLERLRTSVEYQLANNRYEGELIGALTIRSDDNNRFKTSIFYQFRRWINFELAYVYDERDSNRDIIDFDRNRIVMNALITL